MIVVYEKTIGDKILDHKRMADINGRKIEKILLTNAEWLQLRDETYWLSGLQLTKSITYAGVTLELEK